jgi:4-amino-4-deoxy-L-arabinose transferase-like glycosyltransferase
MLNFLAWLKVPHHRWLAGILLAGLMLRLIVAMLLPIGFDEAYYYIYTLHPSWSYFDHPPLVFLTTGIGVWLTGAVNPFTVRLGTLLLYTGSLIFFYKAAARLFDRQVALIALGLVSLMPILTIAFGVLTMPDTPLLFFWMATLWLAAVEFFGSSPYKPTYRVALIGLLVGLACLGKYHGFLLGACLVGFCLTSSEHRRVLHSFWIVLASLIFALTISPVLYWNSSHEWASFRFQSGRAVPNAAYNWESFILTFLVHMVYLFPAFGFPLVGAIGRNLQHQFQGAANKKEPHGQRRLVLWLSTPVILAFAIIAGYQQVLPSWPMAAYMTGTILLAEQANYWLKKYPRRFWNWLIVSGVIIQFLFAIALPHVAFGAFQKGSPTAIGGGFLATDIDTSVQLIDVGQLQRALKGSPTIRAAIDRSDFIFINRYFPSGQLAMALHSVTNKPLTCFTADLRGFAYWSRAEEWVGKNGLYIGSETFDVSASLVPSKVTNVNDPPLQDYFQEIKEVATIPLTRGGVVTQTWQVYEAKEMLKPYPRPYGLRAADS